MSRSGQIRRFSSKALIENPNEDPVDSPINDDEDFAARILVAQPGQAPQTKILFTILIKRCGARKNNRKSASWNQSSAIYLSSSDGWLPELQGKLTHGLARCR
ncbi:MAG: hypothetical protein AB1717_06345 [Pseudomonadota bacterium]